MEPKVFISFFFKCALFFYQSLPCFTIGVDYFLLIFCVFHPIPAECVRISMSDNDSRESKSGKDSFHKEEHPTSKCLNIT